MMTFKRWKFSTAFSYYLQIMQMISVGYRYGALHIPLKKFRIALPIFCRCPVNNKESFYEYFMG